MTLKKEIEKDIIRWKNLPCIWICIINIEKILLWNLLYWIKISTQSFKDLKWKIFSSMCKHKIPERAKIILSNKSIAGGIITPNLKLYYRDKVNKSNGIVIKQSIDQWNQNEELNINLNNYRHLIFERAEIHRKDSIF